MAITVENRTNLVGLVVGMFGAAPGASVLSDLVASFEAGATLKQIAANVANTTEFTSIFPTFLTNEEFATKVVNQLVGTEVVAAEKAAAVVTLTTMLNGGASRTDVFVDAIAALDAIPATNTAWANAAAAFDNKVSVAVYYSVDKQLSASTLADLQKVIINVTSAAATVTTAKAEADNTETVGDTFTFTTGSDTFVGTNGNDTFKASTGLSADGTTAITTTNALDSIDGGAGTDTLLIENTGGKNILTGTITNVENVTFVGAGAVNATNALSAAQFSGTVKFQQTDDTTIAVTAITGQTIAFDTAAAATVATLTYGATQASATISQVKGAGALTANVTGAKLATLNVSTDKTAGTLLVTDTTAVNTIKTANIAASGTAAVSIDSDVLEAVTITGAGAVTLTAATAPTKTLDASGSTGGVTYATDLVAQQFTGGAGKDSVQFAATTKAQTLGAGDDTATISVDLGTGGTIDGGDGSDTLQMTATLAATLNANDKFNAKVSNFEKLSITAATTQTLDLNNLDGLNYVKEAGTGATLTINNFVSGGTLEFSDTSTTTVVSVKDSATGTADVFNAKVSGAATIAAGTLTAANIETVNIDADDTAAAPAQDGSVKHTLTLTADKATTLMVSGDAALDLTLTGSTKVTSIDASANTAGLTVSLSVASGITVTGSAKADAITLGNLSIVTGGAGKDAYTVATPTNGNTYSTITDFVATETLQFTEATGAGTPTPATLGAKLALAGTAAFADFLAAASAADGSANSAVKWFQYSGDTYVVFDNSVSTTFDNGVDQLVKLTGALDLSKSTVDANALLTFVA